MTAAATTTSPDWAHLARELTAVLHPSAPPISITFSPAPPGGVEPYDGPMAPAGADGRTGRVAAGCVFWMRSTARTFSTVPADHGNCSVGSYTHGMIGLGEAALRSDVATLLQTGWVDEHAMASVPAVSERPGAVTYGPLEATPVDPDVVLVRLTPRSMMILSDALPGLRIEGKPQCHIVAVAKERGEVAASVGCALSRARTGMPATEMAAAIPAARLPGVVEAIRRAVETDGHVAAYAAQDARRFG